MNEPEDEKYWKEDRACRVRMDESDEMERERELFRARMRMGEDAPEYDRFWPNGERLSDEEIAMLEEEAVSA